MDYNNSGGNVLLTAEANTATATPEPASLLLFTSGLLGLAFVFRRRVVIGRPKRGKATLRKSKRLERLAVTQSPAVSGGERL